MTAWPSWPDTRINILTWPWLIRHMGLVFVNNATHILNPSGLRLLTNLILALMLPPPDEKYFSELRRVSVNQIIFGANHFISRLGSPDSACWIVWDKQNGDNCFADCELAWTSFQTAVRIFRFRWQGMLQGNMRQKESRIHPTQKPIDLYRWIYRKYAKPGDKILDTHLGSGSSRRAAHDFNLDFVGCEIDKYYFDLQEKAWSEYTSQLNLFNLEETKNDEN